MTSRPTPSDFATVYEALAGFERVYSFHLSAKFSGTWEGAKLGAGGNWARGSAPWTPSRRRSGHAARSQCPATSRARDDGRGIEVLIEASAGGRPRLRGRHARFLARGGRIGRAQAWAGELLSIRPILTVDDGGIVPVKRVRGNQKAFTEFQRRSRWRRSTGRRSVWRSRTRTRSKAGRRCASMSRDVQPRGQIEEAGKLGLVVRTHAGPGRSASSGSTIA